MTTQNILLVDVGNSSVKWRLQSRVDTKKLSAMSQQQYPEHISASFFNSCWKDLKRPDKVIVSCVANKDVWLALQQSCAELWSVQAEKIVSTKEERGLINAYKEPSALGSDRWCAMLAVYNEINSDFIVVDCGSAITIDVVNKSGKHRGGYILPGLTMMKKSLATDTARVNVNLNDFPATLLPGDSTASCVDSAIFLSVVKLIEAVFEQQIRQCKNVQCVLTGGDALMVAELLSIKYLIMPDLVLRGLAYIADSRIENNNN